MAPLPRTLLITPMFPPRGGGVASWLGALAAHLPSGSVTVLAPPGTDDLDVRRLELNGQGSSWRTGVARLLRPASASISRAVAYLPALLSAIRTERPTILQCGHLQLGLAVLLASRWARVPYVVHAYGDELLPRSRRLRGRVGDLFTRTVLRRASAVITISDFSRELVRAWGVTEARIHKVTPGAEASAPAPHVDRRELPNELRGLRRPLILSVGRLIAQKGHGQLLRCLPRILVEHPEATCVIAGQGPLEGELRRLADSLGIGDHIQILGFVPEAVLAHLYASCDVFVLLNRDLSHQRKVEGFGLVFLEAGARGKPVIGGANGGAVDAVVHGVTGYLVDPEDSDETARALLTLLGDPERAQEMGKAGRERIERELSWGRCAAQVAEVLRRVSADPRAPDR